jgi:hypothetical protein
MARENLVARIVVTFMMPAFTMASVLAQAIAPPVPRRILFVGDSFTYAQDGVYTHFARLAAVANPPLAVRSDKSVFGGAFLHRLWDLQEPVQAINTAAYEVVVLQEDIPETTVDDFREYAGKFVAEVRKNHARPVLFMAWAYPRLGWISMAEIAQAHRDVAKQLDVDVAPVGLAWQSVEPAPWHELLRTGPRTPQHLRHVSRHLRCVRHDLQPGSKRACVRAFRHCSGRRGILAKNRLADCSRLSRRADLKPRTRRLSRRSCTALEAADALQHRGHPLVSQLTRADPSREN